MIPLTKIMAGLLAISAMLTSASARGTQESETVDADTAKLWSKPYRGWHYYPDHVIPAKPNIKAAKDINRL